MSRPRGKKAPVRLSVGVDPTSHAKLSRLANRHDVSLAWNGSQGDRRLHRAARSRRSGRVAIAAGRGERALAIGMREPIYLDYQATTPLDPRVRAAMLPYLEDRFGNPHSEHVFGWEAAEAVDEAARNVAGLIGADAGEIVFTSGATEANNLAIQGIARSAGRRRQSHRDDGDRT